MKQRFSLGDIRALIIDIDGTLLRGSLPMHGLVDLFALLRTGGIPFVVASNNATKSPARYRHILGDMGVEVEFVPTDWKTLINGVVAGKYDIVMTGTPKGVGPVLAGEVFAGSVLSGETELVRQEWQAE